ncbi:hypothetical protein ACSBOB_27730 [Mesorhizobium sp. ASY16-5R]|uniref:hypothetical protein n=1 Tax=Mesorhizobium sp. ASY16-5R TaxID=3445772 RepID=UPI003F9F9E28
MNLLDAAVRQLKPLKSSEALRNNQTLREFVWSASGLHQFYVGLIAVCVSLLNFLPIELQRRIVDDAISNRDLHALILLGSLYLLSLVVYSTLKYVLMVYQGWVGESAVKTARDQLAVVASNRLGRFNLASDQTANVIGNEIDAVGGFVGTSISEFIVNISMIIAVFSYMVYVQPQIAVFSSFMLVPQVVFARFLQKKLNTLVEHQVTLVRELGDRAVDSQSSKAHMLDTTLQVVGMIFRNRIALYLLKYGLKSILNIANSIGSLSVLVVGGYLVINGETTLGIVVAFISGFQRLVEPMGDLLDFYRTYSQTKVQYRLIVDWIATEPAAD